MSPKVLASVIAGAVSTVGVVSSPGVALTLPDTARMTAEVIGADGETMLAAGPWTENGMPKKTAEGHISHRAWRVPGEMASINVLTGDLSRQLTESGYRIVFECADRGCGGFDFRYELEVVPEPDMHIDLENFRYVLLERAKGTEPEFAVLIVSRGNGGAFVQMTEVQASPVSAAATPSVAGAVALSTFSAAPILSDVVPAAQVDMAAILERDGRVALDDLVFPSGKAELGVGQYASLEGLAAYLELHPDKRITLVGHTDATGPLDTNVALSRRRAESVAERLIRDLGVRDGQVDAEGVGFLSPRATNLTEDGRRENRRVEAMLASTR